MARAIPPYIRWGTNYRNLLRIGYFDLATSYPEPREGSEVLAYPSGIRDAWTIGTDQRLAGTCPHIPTRDAVDPAYATGWDGVAGFGEFLTWARDANVARVYPEGRNLVETPAMNVDTDGSGVVDSFFTQQTVGMPVTYSLDGANAAQKIAVAGAHALTGLAEVRQVVWGLQAGDVVSLSVDLWIGSAVGTFRGHITALWLDVNGAALSGLPQFGATNLASTSPTRVLLANQVAPTGAAAVDLRFGVTISTAGATGNAWIRNAQLEFGPVCNTLVVPVQVESYLVEPMRGEPPLEEDGTRTVRLQFVASSSSSRFTGY